MATTNTYVGPQDGWVQVVAAASAAVRISIIPQNHNFYVYGGPTLPAATVVGIAVPCGCFEIDNGTSDLFWVRVGTPVPNSSQADGRARIDSYSATVPVTP